jgi:hypothetical protein
MREHLRCLEIRHGRDGRLKILTALIKLHDHRRRYRRTGFDSGNAGLTIRPTSGTEGRDYLRMSRFTMRK